MMTEQARRPLAIVTATARPDLLSQGSHVAPSPQRRIPCKRHETELIYCPIYGFKPPVLATRGLTPAFFCGPTAHPPPSFAPLTKPRQPLCGRISGLVGAFSPFFSIAKPLRGCLRGRSGRARGQQATGGAGGRHAPRRGAAIGGGLEAFGSTARPLWGRD